MPLTYSLVSNPNDGTISNFNALTGTFTYMPNPGFVGTDTFTYQVTASGPNSSAAAAVSNSGTITITVDAAPVVIPVKPVTLTNVQFVLNKHHQVVSIITIFSGALDFSEASNKSNYRLATPGKRGSYTAKNAGIIRLKKVAYTSGSTRVTLTPTKPFTLKKPIQLLVYGSAPSGIQDSLGRYLDAADTGQAGTNAIAILSKNVVNIVSP